MQPNALRKRPLLRRDTGWAEEMRGVRSIETLGPFAGGRRELQGLQRGLDARRERRLSGSIGPGRSSNGGRLRQDARRRQEMQGSQNLPRRAMLEWRR